MAQKIYEKAGEIFDELANSRFHRIMIRAEFLRGVLAYRQEDRDNARQIFRNVLERMPDAELANETLFNLAEVYGIEQRLYGPTRSAPHGWSSRSAFQAVAHSWYGAFNCCTG